MEFTLGTWNAYAITIDQTTYTRNVFVNGVLIDECFGTGPLGFTPDMIAIGRGGDGDLYGATARASTGYVREFAVFDSVLTQAEVEAYIVESAAPGLDVHSATRAAILCSCCVVGLLLRR